MIHFIRIPKTASRSVKQTKLFTCRDHVPVFRLEKKYKDTWEGDIKFCIIRNPYARLVSAFFAGKDFYENGKFPSFREFSNYPSFQSFCLDKDNPFFFGKVNRLPRKNSNRSILVVHPHFRPQCFWIKSADGKLGVDTMLRFENLENEWRDFLKSLKIDFVPLKHRNASNHYNWKYYYPRHVADVVYDIYREDFRRLRYKKDSYKT